MAVNAATYTTYEIVGQREDLSDEVFDISPIETPVASTIDRGNASARTVDWQLDELAAAAQNTKLEGDESTPEQQDPTDRPAAICQILTKDGSVSGTADAVDMAGRTEETDYQKLKDGNELKRDLEWAITRNQGSAIGDRNTARVMASMESWLTDTVADPNSPYVSLGTMGNASSPGWQGSYDVTAPTDDSSPGPLTEDACKTVVKQAWINGGMPSLWLCGPNAKQKISSFSGIATQYRENRGVSQATILGAADVYVSDFGVHNVVPDRFNRDRTILMLDMRYWRLRELRPMFSQDLAIKGDSREWQIVEECTLEASNWKASGKVADYDLSQA